jgi:hypothetical protein
VSEQYQVEKAADYPRLSPSFHPKSIAAGARYKCPVDSDIKDKVVRDLYSDVEGQNLGVFVEGFWTECSFV